MTEFALLSEARRRWRAVAALTAAVGLLLGGLWLRRAAWDATEAERFPPDLLNAYHWGGQANRLGILNLYRHAETRNRRDLTLYLDYPPLRLWVMAKWVRWTRRSFPGLAGWDRSYAFVAPLLRLNTACELAAALLLYALVTLWSARSELATVGARPPPGWISTPRSRRQGALAALLLWLDPALLWDAHCWPQWDVWAVTFFLAAALVASLDGWWTAGLLLGIGSLLKGQLVTVAPFFVLWPLFARRPSCALRAALGFATGIACGGSLWLVGTVDAERWRLAPTAVLWVARAVGAALLLFPWPGLRERPAQRVAVFAGAVLLLFAPGGAGGSPWSLAVALSALVGAWFARVQASRVAPLWAATGGLLGLVCCVPLFHPDLAWIRMGWFYGARLHPALTMGNAANLASLLRDTHPDWAGLVSPCVKRSLVALYVSGLVLSSWAAARAVRMASPRVLACLAAPWVLFFALLPQMHERYLVFAAAATCAFAAVSALGMATHLVFSAAALAMMVPPASLPGPLADLLVREDMLRPAVAVCVLGCALAWMALALRRSAQRPAEAADA